MKVESNGGWLRLRWTFQGERFCLYLGLQDSKSARRKAESAALNIEADIEEGKFDPTLARYKSEKLDAPRTKPTEISCEELLDKWLKSKAAFCDKKTIQWYRGGLTPLLPDNAVARLTPADAREIAANLQQSGLSPQTIYRKLEGLEACWQWGIEQRLCASNPWRGTKQLIQRPQKPRPQPFSKEEVSQIIAGFEQSRYSQLTPFIKFLFGTGCRVGEAIGLRWEHVNSERVTICEQLTRDGKRKPPKAGKIRELRLSANLQELLHNIRGEPTPDALVFQWNGNQIDSCNFTRRAWEPILAEQGIKYRSPRNTRHTFVSHCLEAGMNPLQIALFTGHDVKVLFDHYAGIIHTPPLPTLY